MGSARQSAGGCDSGEFRLRLARTGGGDPAPAPGPTDFVAAFALPGLPPLASRVVIATREEAATLPGPWYAHPLLAGHAYKWTLTNLATGETVHAGPGPLLPPPPAG